MQRNKLPTALILSLLSIALLLSACGGGAEEPQAAPTTGAETVSGNSGTTQDASAAEVTAAAPSPTATLPAAGEAWVTYTIVPAESRASYTVDEEFFELALSKLGMDSGINTVIGSTQQVAGELELNPETLALGENRFVVDLSTLESDDNRRDGWIRDNGPSFNRFREAVFVANSLTGLPDSYNEGEEVTFQVAGDLTIHGVTVPVAFDAQATLQGDTISGTMTTQSLLTDFDIEPPSFVQTLTVNNEFVIQVDFTAVRQ